MWRFSWSIIFTRYQEKGIGIAFTRKKNQHWWKTNCETRKPNIDKTGGVNEEQ